MIDLDNVDDSDSVVRILVRELRAARGVVRAVRNHLEAEQCFGPHYGILRANVDAYDEAVKP